MHYDALIIGAGLSGLGAAIRLALGGLKVRVFERHSIPGGLNSYYAKGRTFQDVGLHAITNYAPENQRSATLNTILRQLRIRREELQLCRQLQSEIAFPGMTLRLNNDFGTFRAEIRDNFPNELKAFDKLVNSLPDFHSMTGKEDSLSARHVLEQELKEPLLREMLLCPVMFYGNPLPRDMSFAQFAVMFRSVIMEGMARPLGGMKAIMQLLTARFRSLDGELSLGNGIESIVCKDGMVQRIVDSEGKVHTADFYISSIGALETAQLCKEANILPFRMRPGEMAFLEAIYYLDCSAASLGIGQTVIFRSAEDKLSFDVPDDDIDCRSHLLCMPGNFEGCSGIEASNSIRVSVPASARRWFAKNDNEYAIAKQNAGEKMKGIAIGMFPSIKSHTTGQELFTPCTVKRFTGHINGAIYGSPDKLRDGKTLMNNLRICGTDQGLLGIVGSLTSGIITANSLLI